MPNISTLVADIYATLEGSKEPSKFTSVSVNEHFVRALKPREYKREPNTLRFSEVGSQCPRQLWFKYHRPEKAEKIDGNTAMTFLYGHVLESLTLSIVEAAGHVVTGQQKQAVIRLSDGWQIRGSADAFIDGTLIDVKSVTKQSEDKFKDGLPPDKDPWGYRLQLSGYATAFGETEAGFLTVRKERGHFGYYPIRVDHAWTLDKLEERVAAVKGKLDDIPRQELVPEGRSGNMKLCTLCSYCGFKQECWPEAKKFVYAKGPVWLQEIKKQPKVDEEVL